jgi:Pentapeptide repeats (8 copies)
MRMDVPLSAHLGRVTLLAEALETELSACWEMWEGDRLWSKLEEVSSRTDGRLLWKILSLGSAALGIVGAIALIYSLAVGTVRAGFGEDKSVTTTEKRDQQGNIVETTTTTTPQDAKTLWDWLSLLGVPFSLVILGFILQQLQQSRAEQQAKAEKVSAEQKAKTEKEIAEQQVKAEKEIVESNQRDEALQNYLDRLSELLIDKNLIATAIKPRHYDKKQTESSQPLLTLEEEGSLNAASDVIRARTLFLLRRLGEDRERKGDVIRFLIEAEVISKLKLNLRGANLMGVHLNSANLMGANLVYANLMSANLFCANLMGANLNSVKLVGANLVGANLNSANLNSANLMGANLVGANLVGANLNSANLMSANLMSANLNGANLSGADLSGAKDWTEAQLAEAKLNGTILPEGCNLNPNRDAEA